ncbi:hypothetical protein, partial [Arsenophonus nasoniae]|uniref:hypothetical protein n=1 Tax=Arsenophonus nasoniae TaxID=638 RepID=UPI00387A4B07
DNRDSKMKFEELSEQSQEAAREVLVYTLKKEIDSRGDIASNRAKYLTHAIRNSFIALETEEPKRGSGED